MEHKCEYKDVQCKGEVQIRLLFHKQWKMSLCDVHYNKMLELQKNYAEATKDFPTAEEIAREGYESLIRWKI